VLAGAAVIVLSRFPWAFSICMALIVGYCTFELTRAALPEEARAKAWKNPWVMLLSLLIGAMELLPFGFKTAWNHTASHGYSLICTVLLAASVLFFALLMVKPTFKPLANFTLIAFFALIFGMLAMSALFLRNTEHGLLALVLAVGVPELCDIFAYLTGSRLGRHKLAPKISPKKSVEGLIGGLVCATLLGLGIAALVSHLRGGIIRNYWFLAFVLFFSALIGQFSDLSLSLIKRANSVKDFGRLLPGHGGLMDRLDSLVFTVPLFYLMCVANESLLFL